MEGPKLPRLRVYRAEGVRVNIPRTHKTNLPRDSVKAIEDLVNVSVFWELSCGTFLADEAEVVRCGFSRNREFGRFAPKSSSPLFHDKVLEM